MALYKWTILLMFSVFFDVSVVIHCQQLAAPRGPWELAFKVIGGNWNETATGYATFWELFTSGDSYTSGDPVQDMRDFSTSGDTFKSDLVQKWEDSYISVQALKMAFFKNNEEKAYIVFNGAGRSKTSWFKCDNILYSSYTDLPDISLGEECPGRSTMGYPLTMMKLSFWQAACPDTTGWLLVTDTDLNPSWVPCPDYIPNGGSEPLPNFKYSNQSTVADLTTQLETADSMAIFFQVWDLVFKGVEGLRPALPGLSNITGLFISDELENDGADTSVRNLQHSQASQIFKSRVINMWNSYFIDTVKFSMYNGGVERAYVVFDATNADRITWFAEDNILYSSYGNDLDTAALAICSIEGDSFRNWQIQSVGNQGNPDGCSETDQMGWMLVKEHRNNGTCSWDSSNVKKPYFLYNTETTPSSPANFQYADVMAVFVHGWRMVFKVSAGGLLGGKSSLYSLWSDVGTLNDDVTDATSLSTTTSYKSAIVDQWEAPTTFIRSVKLAAYKDNMEVFWAVFDGTSSSSLDWLDCSRLLYSSPTDMSTMYANDNGYTCGVQGASSSFRFMLGTSLDCGSMSFTGVFAVVDADSACSARTDLPQFLFTNTPGTTVSESTEEQRADMIAIFVDMDNCYVNECHNGATCQDIGGFYQCICAGNYYGTLCSHLDGVYSEWGTWSTCSVTCEDGTVTRTRACTGTEGAGVCTGDGVEVDSCTLDPCPIHGGYNLWGEWGECSETCGPGTKARSRDCNNPVPQNGGDPCAGDSTDSSTCNVTPCPVAGGFSDWSNWGTCSVTCSDGTQSRSRTCTNPSPAHGGSDCTGDTSDTQTCNDGPCPVDGGFSDWSEWDTCSVTCGDGTQTRSRTCTSPAPAHSGADCVGMKSEQMACNIGACPVDGGFSDWSNWDTCSATCSDGTQSRSRTCTNPSPAHGGADCTGATSDTQTCNDGPCPVDGGFSDWSEWDTCSVTCGDGTQTRSRSCINPAPAHGGADCIGITSEPRTCNLGACPVDGGFTDWSNWDTCSVTCSDGTQSRSRTCTNPSPAHGGADCTGDTSDTQTCNDGPCPVDGGFSNWSEWDTCSVTCSDGTQSRSRTCSNPSPAHGGADCTGDTSDTQTCNDGPCPVDGGFSDWSEWDTCSITCSDGTQSRRRTCTNPSPAHGGGDCTGDISDTQTCNDGPCPVDGGFSDWSNWDTCSVTCSDGTQSRSRECTNPSPAHGGADCIGVTSDTQTCNDGPCPVDGGFSDWSEWETCSVTCGDGIQARSRTCINPSPAHGGADCTGDTSDTQACNDGPCPVDGGFSDWNEWDTCSVTCGGGTQTRSRTCTNPTPAHDGADCVGLTSEQEACNLGACPVDGSFSDWSNWGTCSVTCNDGTQSRSRTCSNPSPAQGGADCTGVTSDTQTCNDGPCPVDGVFSDWSEWETCSITCSDGTQSRSRTCTNPSPAHGGADCTGDTSDTQTCNDGPCPVDGGFSDWSEWDTCSVTCGDGIQARSRTCINPAPAHGGVDCVGDKSDTQTCNDGPCPVDGGFSDWSEWHTCSVTCGDGTHTRSRTCTNPAPAHDGADCVGLTSEQEACNLGACPVDGGFSDWSNWDTCSVTCSDGTQSRSRTCTNPSPAHGGSDCTGASSDTHTCNDGPCPVDGGFSNWSEWDTCSATCSDGTQSRSRTCTNPSPGHGGADCTGDTSDTKTCNDGPCPVDGGFSDWSNWGTCSVTCSDGTQSRSRTCSNPSTAHGGDDCTDATSDTQTCNDGPCPVDGGFSDWSEWDTCSVTCSDGTQSRSRTCTNPSPAHGGADCTGDTSDTKTCNDGPCPVDGVFSDWSEWNTCSVTCSDGTQSRSRTCTNPSPAHGGADCTGDTSDTKTCNDGPCPVDGGFSDWSNWGTCSVTCSDGTQSRSRSCTNPSPAHGGADCTGAITDTQACNDGPCPVDGGFSDWSEWDTCSATCGDGSQTRSRSCSNPAPAHGGADCVGMTSEQEACNPGVCPVDGGFNDWSNWDTCSATCSDGTQSRSRSCTNPSPAHGGADCTGAITDTQACNDGPCPVDGGFSDWSEWDTCSVTCGDGSQTRSRSCTNPAPAHDGTDCVGMTSEQEACNLGACPVDGGFSDWSEWDPCSITCSDGTQSRRRTCTNPSPAHGGADCTGDISDTQTCNDGPCPVDGGFSDWSNWDTCSVTCSDGTQSRSRTCTNPSPAHGGADCTGDTSDTQTCNDGPCPVDGGFSDWSEWDTCSATCGDGTQTRSRTCTNPAPTHGGADCVGMTSEQEACNLGACPVDGGFNDWSNWDTCSATCSDGTQSRSRSCTNPSPAHGGADCTGAITDIQACNDGPCPVDGGFSDWSEWDTCSVTCGDGTQTRSRTCTNPAPAHDGADCVGMTSEQEACNLGACPVDGGFSDWSNWDTCSVTCSDGTQSRSRTCTNPSPAHGGADCIGATSDAQTCDDGPCPVDGGFSDWSEWDTCSATCGDGIQTRSRSCTKLAPAHGGSNCVGITSEPWTCNIGACPVDGGLTDWSVWDTCSVTCGDGTQTRSRTCTNPAPAHGGVDCVGLMSEPHTCNPGACPVDGGFTDWSNWDICSVTCSDGTQGRSRTCTNPSPAHGGSDCTGDTSDAQTCNDGSCPVDGGFSDWSEWDRCSVTCGDGTQTRSRSCTNPTPAHGGADCIGMTSEPRACNTLACPVDGGFSDWSEWDTCSATCGDGTQTRSRSCTNPAPAHGGAACFGDISSTQDCNDGPCPVDGGFSDWSEWVPCSVTCGGGTQSRSRTCTNPIPVGGGADCNGPLSEDQACDDGPCPVDGGFSDWNEWDTCSVTCGDGTQTRSRSCTNPTPTDGGADCTGELTDTQSCIGGSCPVDGMFSDWSTWGTCSVTCNDGTTTRTRTCSNPAPENGGLVCIGDGTESTTCNDRPCPIDGDYSVWSSWVTCSATCGDGSMTRIRTCTNPEPQHGGVICSGEASESDYCTHGDCPVDGGFGDWSEWDTCSVTCGDGTHARSRSCTNPTPAHGGLNCVGDSTDFKTCNDGACPLDGGFSDWSEWVTCSVTCGDGTQTRSRACTNPTPAHGGADCVGQLLEQQACNHGLCPVNGGFTEWTTWDTCSITCGDGTTSRDRSCSNPVPQHGGSDCTGDMTQNQACNDRPCPIDGGLSSWGNWGTCSVSCDDGTQMRSRSCTNPEPQFGGLACAGGLEDIQSCNIIPCPVDGGFSDWSEWDTCSVTCGDGTQTRSRSCTNPAAVHGGLDCLGDVIDTQACIDAFCPVDGQFSDWSEWGSCTRTCGSGTETRSRACSNPAPQHGGQDCFGDPMETRDCAITTCPGELGFSLWTSWNVCSQTCGGGSKARSRTCDDVIEGCDGETSEVRDCNTLTCPVDGGFSNWSEWNTCSVTCGDGTQTRSRTCTNPAPAHAGADCLGDLSDIQNCNDGPCPVDGTWSEWTQWASCSTTCGIGSRDRTRICSEPQHGGLDCQGTTMDSENCDVQPCPVNGYWSIWGDWASCTVTCAGGTRDRTRACVEPMYGGLYCPGATTESENCATFDCPIDGYWTEWAPWEACSVTCAGGSRTRVRSCVQPQHGGLDCTGDITEQSEPCGIDLCPVDGYLTDWGTWTSCTVTCGGGTRDRSRTCIEPLNGGNVCPDKELASIEDCNSHACPVDGSLSPWSEWTACSFTCNGGTRTRGRTCSQPLYGGLDCTAHLSEVGVCGMEVCPKVHGAWTEWAGWAACSMTCGFGERSRARTCTAPAPQWGGDYCDGQHLDTEFCKLNVCPVDGAWSNWSQWLPCFNMSSSECQEGAECDCGEGVTARRRLCDSPAPADGGVDCGGNGTEFKYCNKPCFNLRCNAHDTSGCQIVLNLPQTGNSQENHAVRHDKGTTSFCLPLVLCLVLWFRGTYA